MKKALSLALILAVLAPSAQAACRGANYVAGGSAVASMVAGYNSYKAFVKARDIEKLNSQMIFSGGRNAAEEALHRVQQDDTLTISYNLSPERNRQHHISVLEGEIDSRHSSASMYRTQAMQALMPTTETYTDSNGNLQTRTVPGNPGTALMYNNMAEDSERQARRIERELAEVHAGRGSVPVYTLESVLERTGQREAGAHITEMARQGSKILSMSRVPRSAVVKIARAARHGWMLVATAVAMGLVAGEEFLVGKIACKRDADLNNY